MREAEKVIHAFIDRMLSVSLVLIGQTEGGETPQGSGLIWQRGQRHFLLSVGHALDEGDMFVETRVHDRYEGTLLIYIPRPEYDFNIDEHRDFGWAELDFSRLSAKMSEDPRLKGQNVQFECYRGPLDEMPEKGEAYGFAKWNGNDFIAATRQLVRDAVYEICMEYDGVDDRNGFYRFLPVRHKGDVYRGCSGAPIADPSGKVIALLQGGCQSEGVIWGVPTTEFLKMLPSEASV